MTNPTPASSKKITFLKIIISPICLVLIYLLWKHNYTLGAVPIIGFLIFYYTMLPGIARTAARQFNRQSILLLTRGRAAEVPALVKKSFFFRLTAPIGLIDSKLALAYLALEQYEAALACFEKALPYADVAERPTLMLGWVKSLFATGDLRRAEAEGQNIIDRFTKLPELLAIVARSRLGLGKNDDGTKRMLDEAETLSPGDDVRLMIELTRIESAAAAGRKIPSLDDDADSNRKLVRAWIHLVRGILREKKGDLKKARQSFEKAKTEMPCGFVASEAEHRLAALEKGSLEKDISLSKEPKISTTAPVKADKKPTTTAAPKSATDTTAVSFDMKPKGKSSSSNKKKRKRK
jgi:tetratricopeptide (TPR) repeat protein